MLPGAAAIAYAVVARGMNVGLIQTARLAGALRRNWRDPKIVIAYSRVRRVDGTCKSIASTNNLADWLLDDPGFDWLEGVDRLLTQNADIPQHGRFDELPTIDIGHAETNLYQKVARDPNLELESLVAMGVSHPTGPCSGTGYGSANCRMFFRNKDIRIGYIQKNTIPNVY